MRIEVQLSSFIDEISMGPFGSDIKVENFVNDGVPVLNGANLLGYKLNDNSFNYVTKEKAKTFRKAIAKRGDIIITHRGTLGQICYVPENSKFEQYVISQSQFRVKFNEEKIDPRYIVYLFHTTYGQKKLLSFKSHVGVPALAQATTNFRALNILVHKLEDQKKIANVITAIEDKIELNNRINAELEQMAKTIYDYWFVQFDFPISAEYAAAVGQPELEGKPYKSSGGKMVWSAELKREVPEGWEVKSIGELGEISGGSTPSREINKYFTKNGISWITPKDLSLNTGNKFITKGELDVSEQGLKSASLNVMPKGTVLLSSRAPIGYIAISRENVTTNQGFKSFIPTKGYTSEFIFYTLIHMLPTIENNAAGSTFKEVSTSTLKSIKTYFPSKNIVSNFTKTVKSIFEKQNLLELENQKLTELRDWLLPMLMNGQVRVSDVEEDVVGMLVNSKQY